MARDETCRGAQCGGAERAEESRCCCCRCRHGVEVEGVCCNAAGQKDDPAKGNLKSSAQRFHSEDCTGLSHQLSGFVSYWCFQSL